MAKFSAVLVIWLCASTVTAVRRRNALRYTPEAIKPYTDNHLAAPIRTEKSLNIADITSNSWMMNEQNLIQSALSRYVASATISSSASFVEAEFRKLGLDIHIDEFPSVAGDSQMARNIIGRVIGSSSESILIGAHYDSLPSVGPAPGADDNASGVSTLLSVAQALSGAKLKRNLVFVAFSGEEQGMLGSNHFVDTVAPSMNIVGAIILDQNGNPGKSGGIILESVGDTSDKLRIIDTLADSVDGEIRSVVVNHNGFGSDHVALSRAGIPAVLVIERDNMEFAQAYGHTSKDTIDNIDANFGSAIARTVEKAVVRLAMA